MASHFQPRFETDSRASQKSPIIYCVSEPSKGFSEWLWCLWITFGINLKYTVSAMK